MTEAEEVAETLVKPYLEWCSSMGIFPSMNGIRIYVLQQLRKYESYSVMDAVTVALQAVVMPDRYRSDGKLAHAWLKGKHLGFKENSRLYDMYVCRDCGVMRGDPKYPETPCRGKVSVTTRNKNGNV